MLFKTVYTTAETKKAVEAQDEAQSLLNQALIIKSDLLMLSRKPTLASIRYILQEN